MGIATIICTADLGIGVVLAAMILALATLLGAVWFVLGAIFSTLSRIGAFIWRALGGGGRRDALWVDEDECSGGVHYGSWDTPVRICANERCRRRNPLNARFCGRCGWKLTSGS